MTATAPVRSRATARIAIALLALGVASGCGRNERTSSPRTSPNEAAQPTAEPAVVDCAALVLPALGQELNTHLNEERHLLTISVFDETRRADRTFTIDYESPSCLARPELRRVIEHVLDASAGVRVIPWIPLRPRTATAAAPPLARPCRATHLRSRLLLQGAGGALVGGVVLANRGPSRCSLLGRPTVRLVGRAAVAPRWRVVPTPAAPAAPETTRDPVSSLRALRPGKAAWLALHWSNWCGPRSAPASETLRPPDALVVILPQGGGEIRLPLAGAPRCDAPAAPSTLGVAPFVPRERTLPRGSRLPLHASIVGVPPRESKLTPPRLRARAGGLLRYEVALTNVSRRPFRFRGCPVYVQQLVPRGPRELYVLNCRPIATLAPGERAVFAMVLRVPASAPVGPNGLAWQLAPKTYLPAFATARVLVTS